MYLKSCWSESQVEMSSTEMRIWLAHDCFRPASWVSFWLSVSVAMATPTHLGVTFLGLVILSAAVAIGVGEVPASLPLWSETARAHRWPLSGCIEANSELPHGMQWQVFRTLWPGVGFLVGLLVLEALAPSGLEEFLFRVSEAGLIIALTTLTVILFYAAGFLVADVFTGTLLTAWTAIPVFGWFVTFMPTWLAWMKPCVLVGLWTCFSGVFLCLRKLFPGGYSEPFESFMHREKPVTDSHKQDIFSSIGLLGILPSRSPWRKSVRIISIGVLLLAMVCWLLLTASPVPRYEILASIVYGAVAIPAACLLDGYRVVNGWDRIVKRRYSVHWWEMLTIPHRVSQATTALIGSGVIILWPPLVVSLTSYGSAGAGNALRATGCLTINMLFTTIVCVVFQGFRVRNETVFAFSLATWLGGTLVTTDVLLRWF